MSFGEQMVYRLCIKDNRSSIGQLFGILPEFKNSISSLDYSIVVASRQNNQWQNQNEFEREYEAFF